MLLTSKMAKNNQKTHNNLKNFTEVDFKFLIHSVRENIASQNADSLSLQEIKYKFML